MSKLTHSTGAGMREIELRKAQADWEISNADLILYRKAQAIAIGAVGVARANKDPMLVAAITEDIVNLANSAQQHQSAITSGVS